MSKNKEPLFAERLIEAMRIRNIRAIKLCEMTGLSQSDISNYRHGYYKPNPASLIKIAKALDVAPEWLDGYDVPMVQKHESNVAPLSSNKVRQINMLEFISCGCGTFNDGQVVAVLSLPDEMFSPYKEYFAITAKGDSMINAGIDDGDILIFERSDVPVDNKIGAFCLENETALCKRYKTKDGKIYLLSANEEYAPIIIDPLDECFRCVGILSSITKKVNNEL